MKRVSLYLAAAAMTAFSLVSCKNEKLENSKATQKGIKFGISSLRTKTIYDENDALQINWVSGDKIKIFCAEAESAKSASYVVTPTSTAKNGTISNASEDVLQWGGDGQIHNFYAIYPGDGSGLKVDENGIASFTINHNQKCTVSTTNGYDNNVIAKPDMKNALMVANTSTVPTDDVVSLISNRL